MKRYILKLIKYRGKDLSTNDFTNEYKKKIDAMQTLYRFKGAVDTINDLYLIQEKNVGDVYKCEEDTNNYIWNSTEWINAGHDTDYSVILDSINNITEHNYTQVIKTDITANTAFTIPCYYKVGSNVLEVYWNGKKLLLSLDDNGTDGHYREIGENGTISNQIKTTSDWNLMVGDVLEFVVKGEYNV